RPNTDPNVIICQSNSGHCKNTVPDDCKNYGTLPQPFCRPPGCAVDACHSGQPNPGGQITYCCFHFSEFPKICPGGEDRSTCLNFNDTLFHELGHMCSGRCQIIDPATERAMSAFASCVLGHLRCKG